MGGKNVTPQDVIAETNQDKQALSEAKKRSERGIKQVLRGSRNSERYGEINRGEYLRYDFKVDSQGLKSYNK